MPMPFHLRLPAPDPDAYQAADPFPHAVFDGAVSDVIGTLARAELLRLAREREGELYRYDNPLERKRAFDDVERMPMVSRSILGDLSSPTFLRWLEELTGIAGLLPDPFLRGGGAHLIPPGGKLDVHIDYNLHPTLHLHRRVNTLLYLNPGWSEADGGALELWRGRRIIEDAGRAWHELLDRRQRILPVLGRLVVFSTSEESYHGHPEPTGPEWRVSLSAYYYTAHREGAAPAHSTTFLRRPDEPVDPEVEALRRTRARGRVASNV